jgi:hypothetical protein
MKRDHHLADRGIAETKQLIASFSAEVSAAGQSVLGTLKAFGFECHQQLRLELYSPSP